MNWQLIDSLMFTALGLMIGHWIPKGPYKFHVVINYIAGVLAIFLGVTIYILKVGRGIMIQEAWLFPVAGGVAVVGAYIWDWAMNRLSRDTCNVGTPTDQD